MLCAYNYKKWYKEESDHSTIKDDDELDDLQMPLLEDDDDKVNKEEWVKTLTPNKRLTKLPVLLAQVKAGKNSCKLKNKIIQILYLLCQHNKITKMVLQQFNQVIKIMMGFYIDEKKLFTRI